MYACANFIGDPELLSLSLMISVTLNWKELLCKLDNIYILGASPTFVVKVFSVQVIHNVMGIL